MDPLPTQHFRLGRGQADIVTDAEQHRFGRSALLDDERPVLVFRAAEQLVEAGASAEGRNDDGVSVLPGCISNSSGQFSELYS